MISASTDNAISPGPFPPASTTFNTLISTSARPGAQNFLGASLPIFGPVARTLVRAEVKVANNESPPGADAPSDREELG
jgi:hypothetical protein